ncbi:helix-turn-helix domain-containing protein [Sporosarcina sp. UB5]|uniref:helix-turn-helix domain-containing protein n=1 Tax=Sporosarcina sp. UB5 TaxID=3047463 RepID=UPI003D7996FA
MKAYGETLRQIREQKGLTMKELSDGICSVSFLSKFERGDSDITLGLFTRLLEKLMVGFDEFLFVHRDFQPSRLEQFFKAVSSAYQRRDSDVLRKLKEQELKKWKQTGVKTYQYHVLMIQVFEMIVDNKAIDEEINKEHIQSLADYLFHVEVWGHYEFMLYNTTILFLNTDMVLQLSRTAYEKSIRYREFQKVDDLIATIIMNTIIYLLGSVNHFNKEMRFQAELNEFFSYLETLALPESRLFERVNLMHLRGAFELRLGNKEEGIAAIRTAIHLLSELGAVRHAKSIENYLDQILAF